MGPTSAVGEHSPLREDLVYCHPDTMTSCGFVINQPVMVTIKMPLEPSIANDASDVGHNVIVMKTWPLPRFPLDRECVLEYLYNFHGQYNNIFYSLSYCPAKYGNKC